MRGVQAIVDTNIAPHRRTTIDGEQLKYDDTNKELALALLSGVKAFYDAT